MRKNECTHHDSSIEAPGPDSDHDVLANTLQNLATADEEAVCAPEFSIFFHQKLQAFFERKFLDDIRFASCAGFIESNTGAGEKDSVAGYDFAWFDERYVTDK